MQQQHEFLALVRQHQGIILKLVGLYAGHAHTDRQDMYQEILYQAYKSFHRFRGDAKFSTWLYRVCLNTIFTMQRKKPQERYADTLADHLAQGAAQPILHEDRQLLYTAIRQLPETDRALITLHLDGYSNAEIADLIGISANNTSVKLHRIKAALQHLLQPIAP
jgi:RNA polymerase sigma factor (sigma-70 family)